MEKCAIITSYLEGDLKVFINEFNPDFIICADGGYDHASAAGITPDLLIGDLDSIAAAGKEVETIIYPSEKDDTDTGICLSYALEHGFRDILIIGGLGGRLDHTVSNIQLITGKCHLADRISIIDKGNQCTAINGASITMKKVPGQYVSIFSMSEASTGVTTAGLKYPLKDAVLRSGSTLGTSNEFTEESATVSVKEGILLIVRSDEHREADS